MKQFLAACVLANWCHVTARLQVFPSKPVTKYVTLEMYAAFSAGEDITQPENVDIFDASGLAKFLSTEIVIETGKDPVRTAREKGIDTIVKYQIRIRNNQTSSDVNVQAEFARYVRFENGAVVSPEDADMFARSGDLVGMQSYHPPAGDVRYPTDATFYWFSLSGRCPNMPTGQKQSANCTKYNQGLVPSSKSQYVAGGLCKRMFTSQIPDGTPGCAYFVQNYSVMKVDALVGINQEDCGGRKCADWQDFRFHCSNSNLSFTHLGVRYCKEYDFPGCITSCEDTSCKPQNEVGIRFWTGRCNKTRNSERAKAIQSAFGGSMVETFYAQNPACDQYSPMCDKPVKEVGVSYCHRDASGVCDVCYVPGTSTPPSPKPASQVACRIDLFLNKKKRQYKDALPVCASDCSGNCSLKSDKDACCVYIGKCKHVWQQEDWGECDAKCGNGTRSRRVWCPFEDMFGPCDEKSRPANSTSCRGDSCPWSTKSFGNWSQCDNGCGDGNQTQSLICDCPDDCPLGEKECERSTKPAQPTRPCFPIGSKSGSEFCSVCPSSSAQATTCTACPSGFKLEGVCKNERRVVLVSYGMHSNAVLSDWLASAFVPAFKDALKQMTNISVDVLNVTNFSQFIGMVSAPPTAEVLVVAESQDNTDESLNRTSNTLVGVDLHRFADSFLQMLATHGCTAEHGCSLPASISFNLTKQPDLLCPPPQVWHANSCFVPGPGSKPFPGWGIALIVLGVLLVVAVVAWTTCGYCKRVNADNSRLLGAA